MKSLEDKIKERLEGYESRLPEGDLAEFKTLLDGAEEGKRRATPIAWIAPVAFAAAAALAVLLAPHPNMEKVNVTGHDQLVAEIAEVAVPVDDMPDAVVDEVVAATPNAGGMKSHLYAQAVAPVPVDEPEIASETKMEEYSEMSDIPEIAATEDSSHDAGAAPYGDVAHAPVTLDITRPISTKVGKAAAGVLGGTGAVIITGLLPSIAVSAGIFDNGYSVGINPQGGKYAVPSDGTLSGDIPLIGERSGQDSHSFPLRAGLSFRVPMNDRWSLTTGVDYSVYSSSIGYMGSSGKHQKAQYIGVPVRADYTLARNRWIDVYVGAGASADLCVAAYEDGNKVAKDGIGFSLIGGGGFQFNINRSFGLFVDPMFSWDMFSNSRVLETYRTEYPFMFSVSGGIRVTLKGKDR